MSLPRKISRALRKQSKLSLRPEILLTPNIPRPMHGVNPRTIMGTSWWNQERRKAYKASSYRCLACGVSKFDALYRKWLEAHELYSVDYQKGRLVYLETVALCYACHNYIHDGRLQALLDTQEITHEKYVKIIQHGNRVLQQAGLSRPPRHVREADISDMLLNGLVAPWKDWRLVFKGKLYPPRFKTEKQWQKAMRKR